MKKISCAELPRPGHPTRLAESEKETLFRELQLEDGEICEAHDGVGRRMRVLFRDRDGPLRIEVAPTSPDSSGWSSLARNPFSLEVGLLPPPAMQSVIAEAVTRGARLLNVWLNESQTVAASAKTLRGLHEKWQHHADQALRGCPRQDRLLIGPARPLAALLMSQEGSGPILWRDTAAPTNAEVFPLADWVARDFRQNGDGARLLIAADEGWDSVSRARLEGHLNSSFPRVIRVSLGGAEAHPPGMITAQAAALRGLEILGMIAIRL